MAASARIDELRSKFDDNPRRYFAPLANEYRKAGDLETAIAICRTQLRHFPTHMSGHVVLGQALYEAGQLAEARTVLARAVELDPENVIALRHLGDIADATGDADDARQWYRRLLDADPYNEQIVARLEALGQPSSPPPADATRSDHHWSEHEPAPEVSDSAADARFEAASPAEFVDLAGDDLAWTSADAPAGSLTEEMSTESLVDAEPLFVDGWAMPEATGESEAAEPTGGPVLVDPVADVFDPVVGLDLVPSPDDAVEQLEHAADATTVAVPDAPVDRPSESIWPPDDAQPLDEVVSGAFVTETMAELCLRQGHDDQALAIYDQLVVQRPDDRELADRARALRERLTSGGGSPTLPDVTTAGAFLDDLAQRQPDDREPPPAPAPIDTWTETIEMAPLLPTGHTMPVPASADADWLDHLELELADDAATPPPPATPRAAAEALAADHGISDGRQAEVPPAATEEAEQRPPSSPREAWAARAWGDAFRPAPAAGGSILDAVIAGSRAGAAAEPAVPETAAADESVAEEDVDLSFERFFVEETDEPAADFAASHAPVWNEAAPTEASTVAPTSAPGRSDPHATASPMAEPPAEETDDDLAAFNAWLRGLRD